jgi:hypothetical protein
MIRWIARNEVNPRNKPVQVNATRSKYRTTGAPGTIGEMKEIGDQVRGVGKKINHKPAEYQPPPLTSFYLV